VEGPSIPSPLVQRPTRSVVITILATLVGGALVGRLLAGLFAPGSDLADTVGVLVFPFCLGGGYTAWRGFGAAIVMPRVARMLFTSRSRAEFAQRLGEAAPELVHRMMRYTIVFVPISLAGGLIAGSIVAVVADTQSRFVIVGTFTLVGAAYGFILRALANRGYLPFPDED